LLGRGGNLPPLVQSERRSRVAARGYQPARNTPTVHEFGLIR